MCSLQIYCLVSKWKNFENRSAFGKVIDKHMVTSLSPIDATELLQHRVVLCVLCCVQAAIDESEVGDARRQLGVVAKAAALESRVSELENDVTSRDETIRDHRTHHVLLHFAWVVDDAKCIVVMHVCVFVCLSAAACSHYCTDPDVILGSDRGCPVVVHYWADLQSVHGLLCYGNITLTQNVTEYTLYA